MKQKKHRSRRPKLFNRILNFTLPERLDKPLFLDIILDIIGDNDVNIEVKLDKVNIELKGEKNKVNNIAEKIITIESALEDAFNSDGDGFFYYSYEFLSKLFKIQLPLIYLTQALDMSGFQSYLQDQTIKTVAKLDQLKLIHQKANDARNSISQNHHKDIQRFLALYVLLYAIREDYLIDIVLENEILKMVDSNLQFAIEIDLAYSTLSKYLNENIELLESEIDYESTTSLDLLSDVGFSGGKVVFMKNGEELDQSLYEIENEPEFKNEDHDK